MRDLEPPIRLLIVEDSPTQAQELVLILEEQGFLVDVAGDGLQGLDMFQADRYDLVLSDIQMPGLNGYELCQRLKADPARKDTPVILLTALSGPTDILQGLECGADNFITKPYDPAYLVGRIIHILTNKKLRATRKFKVGVELNIGGKSVAINSDREQILDVLISTFDEYIRTREREQAHQVAAEAARQSQRFLQSTLDALGAHICILDQEGSIVAVNASWRRFAQAHGWYGTPGQVGVNYLDACQGVAGAAAIPARALARGIQHVITGDRETFFCVVPYATNDAPRWFSVRVTRLENTRPARVVVSHTDDTALNRKEQHLKMQYALTRVLAEASTPREAATRILEAIGASTGWEVGTIWTLDRPSQLLRCFQLWHAPDVTAAAFENMTRDAAFPPGDGLPGRVWQQGRTIWIGDIARESFLFRAPAALRDGLTSAVSFPVRAGDDLLGVVEFFARDIRQPDEEMLRLFESIGSQFGQFIERKRAEERTREQALLLEKANDAVLVEDLEGTILFWNQGAERLYGWTAEEVLGKNVTQLICVTPPEELAEAFRTVLERGEWAGELQQVNRASKKLLVKSSWTLMRDENNQSQSVLIINTDATEQKRLEAQILRTQRLESIGTLAGGIAHDLNNVLTPLMMGTQLLKMQITEPTLTSLLSSMNVSVQRGAEMVKQILLFARGSETEFQPLQLRPLVNELCKMLEHTFPKSITIRTVLPKDLHSISGDTTQLYQVLMNLCVNARDAMPEGGTLTLSIEDVILDEHLVHRNPEAKPGPYLLLTVMDSGTGIAPEIIDKIFDPFFTTKEKDKGTGLGLSTVLGVVKAHGGFVKVYSELGRGSRFHVYLPALPAEASSRSWYEKTDLPAGRGELILVVDDEAAVREIVKGMLEAYGYRVQAATNGREALDLYAQLREEVRLILTDSQMPIMDGLTFVKEVRKLGGNIPIIAASGLAAKGEAVEVKSIGADAFLIKPFTAEKLLTTLRRMLGEQQAANTSDGPNAAAAEIGVGARK